MAEGIDWVVCVRLAAFMHNCSNAFGCDQRYMAQHPGGRWLPRLRGVLMVLASSREGSLTVIRRFANSYNVEKLRSSFRIELKVGRAGWKDPAGNKRWHGTGSNRLQQRHPRRAVLYGIPKNRSGSNVNSGKALVFGMR